MGKKKKERPVIGGDGPLYRRMAETLRERIARGVYVVGSFLPTEAELCAEFGLSRFTVREALRRLQEQGLLARRQGSGSQVIAAAAPEAFVHRMTSIPELFQYALDTRFEIRSLRLGRPSRALASAANLPAAETRLLMEAVRRDRSGSQPIAHSHVLIHSDFAAFSDEFRTATGPLYDIVERRAGRAVADVLQSISAERMQAATARILGLGRGATAIRVVRRYSDRAGEALIVSVSDHDAARFRYEMHLNRAE